MPISQAARPIARLSARFFKNPSRLLPILSGLLIGTSYIPFPPWALFFCLVPLFVYWSRAQSAKQAFFSGWITQFILNLIGFHWIAYTTVEFGHFPIWFGLLTLLAFAAIAHLHYALGGWLGFWLEKRFGFSSSARVFVYALAFALMDHRFPMIFPWHLGYPWLWGNLPGHQFADVIGFEGLNVFTILINACLACGVVNFIENKRKAAGAFAVTALATFVALNLAGLGRAEPWKKNDAELEVLAVQGNIGNFDKHMQDKGDKFRDPIVAKYLALTAEGLAQHLEADVVIWPETAFPSVLDQPYLNEAHAVQVRDFIVKNQKPLFTGAYSYDRKTKDTYNGFFFLNAKGEAPVEPHRKSILLVFGETFPFSEYVDYMKYLFPDQGSFGRGKGPQALSVEIDGRQVQIGSQICYEGLYPWFSAGLSRAGAQIFTNVTNDSWFGKKFEPYQHLYMTLARSIEFRRPLVRATNTGITTAVLASGEVLEHSPQDKEWSGLFRVPYQTNPAHTFYEKIAGHWGWALAIALVGLVGFARRKAAAR